MHLEAEMTDGRVPHCGSFGRVADCTLMQSTGRNLHGRLLTEKNDENDLFSCF